MDLSRLHVRPHPGEVAHGKVVRGVRVALGKDFLMNILRLMRENNV